MNIHKSSASALTMDSAVECIAYALRHMGISCITATAIEVRLMVPFEMAVKAEEIAQGLPYDMYVDVTSERVSWGIKVVCRGDVCVVLS